MRYYDSFLSTVDVTIRNIFPSSKTFNIYTGKYNPFLFSTLAVKSKKQGKRGRRKTEAIPIWLYFCH